MRVEYDGLRRSRLPGTQELGGGEGVDVLKSRHAVEVVEAARAAERV